MASLPLRVVIFWTGLVGLRLGDAAGNLASKSDQRILSEAIRWSLLILRPRLRHRPAGKDLPFRTSCIFIISPSSRSRRAGTDRDANIIHTILPGRTIERPRRALVLGFYAGAWICFYITEIRNNTGITKSTNCVITTFIAFFSIKSKRL